MASANVIYQRSYNIMELMTLYADCQNTVWYDHKKLDDEDEDWPRLIYWLQCNVEDYCFIRRWEAVHFKKASDAMKFKLAWC